MSIEQFILILIFYAIPMYVANAMPIILKGKTPIDLNKTLFGKRILGDGKTFKGAIFGIIGGMVAGAILYFAIPNQQIINGNYFLFIFLLAFGAMFGDIVKSFLKRRLNIERGQQWFIADQIDFVVGGLLFSSIVRIPEIEIVIFLLIATIFTHLFSNMVAFRLKLKKVPW